ncbi:MULTISPECIES: hypothetical protein [unclassified Streptomyces]|uniref:hypothetical protein n=1 Tax=unclassified Streptomyces TaxID=2593676 RepID=UPI00202E8982|nr:MULTISPECIES: hypothetical protein [unclassified Streptomyces]MCM1973472.1 hypothetical protein [Streptomyces sp. G1]MCX5129198.1 hypothetical protein [Streptomyces sp. NBC_00347]
MADGQGWERLNEHAYGMVAWRRAVMTCGALVVWSTGYDNRAEPGPRGPRPGRPDAPGAAEFNSVWMRVVALLALAACRAAREADVLVDDVELPTLICWVDGAHTARLHQGPLETGEARERTEAGWLELVGDEGRQRLARQVLADHIAVHMADEGEPGDTGDGTEPPSLTIGDRARAVRAAGIPDLEPEWAGPVSRARARIERLEVALRGGLWTPTREHRRFAEILHGTLVAEPDFPSLPEGFPGPAWVQRVLRMPHIGSTYLAVTELPEFVAYGPLGNAGDPLGSAVGSVATDAVQTTVNLAVDLEKLWAARPADQPVDLWERAHLPAPVRTQVLAVEKVVHELSVILFEVCRRP